MDLTVVLQARGFKGCYEAGAVDFLLCALEGAARSGVRVNLSRIVCAHTGTLTGVLATSALTAAHTAVPPTFFAHSRLPGPNALFHAWVDLPLPYGFDRRALHDALTLSIAHVPAVVLGAAGPPVRRLPPYARALVVALSRGVLACAPPDLTARIDERATSANARAPPGRSRLAHAGRSAPRDAAFLVLDDARDCRDMRAAPALSVYTSSLRVDRTWARFRARAVAAATAPEILSAMLSACTPGFSDVVSTDALFRSIASDGEDWLEKQLRTTPRLPSPLITRHSRRARPAKGRNDDSEDEDDSVMDRKEEDTHTRWTPVTLVIDTQPKEPWRDGMSAMFKSGPAMSVSDEDDPYSSLSASESDFDSETRSVGGRAKPYASDLRFVLRPSSSMGNVPECLASSAIGPMGSALCKSVRLHDYLLGRYNMQRFLLETLVHPATGESLLPLCGAAAEPIPEPEWPTFDSAQEKRIQRQSRRIWDAFISDWHAAMKNDSISRTHALSSVRFDYRPQTLQLRRSLDRLSRGVLARLFYSLTSGIRSAKRNRNASENAEGGQYLEAGDDDS